MYDHDDQAINPTMDQLVVETVIHSVKVIKRNQSEFATYLANTHEF